MFDIFNPDSFYNFGYHFLYFWCLTVFFCLMVDISPLQEKSMCTLNYVLASLLAAIVPTILTNSVDFSSHRIELWVGTVLSIALSIILTLTIQKYLDIDIEL